MAIDACEHEFNELARTVLPRHLKSLRDALESPYPMALFGRKGHGVRGIAKTIGRSADFSGCYVLVEADVPKYVGISRKLLGRLRQHVRGTTHFDASLAYRIASEVRRHGLKRADAMKDLAFLEHFDGSKQRIAAMHVAFVEIENPLVLHVFEPYAAMAFDTHPWNTFATH